MTSIQGWDCKLVLSTDLYLYMNKKMNQVRQVSVNRRHMCPPGQLFKTYETDLLSAELYTSTI